MAEVVTVLTNDNISKILTTQKNIQPHEVHTWLGRVRELNPHISNLDRIYIGERVIIPETLYEHISNHDIWLNVFDHIPPSLCRPYVGPTRIYVAEPGENIDSISEVVFADGPYRSFPLSTKRAVLFHNNPWIVQHVATNRVPMRKIVDITPARISEMDKSFWKMNYQGVSAYLDQLDIKLIKFYQDVGPEEAISIAQMVENLKAIGAAVGMDGLVKGASYSAGGTSGYSAAGAIALSNANGLARELYEEAIQKFGKKIVCSNKTSHISKMQQFLKGHPKYQSLMQHMKKLPKHLLPKGKVVSAMPQATNALARHFRKSFVLPFDKWNSSRYLSSIGRQLNGNVSLLKGIGRGATWYIPATLGIISVANASPEMRMRTLFQEGFGVVGGAIGTWVGAEIIGAGLVSALCLGPLGAFVLVLVCASAMGLIGMEVFRKSGSKIYDYGQQLSNGQVYHSMDQLIESF